MAHLYQDWIQQWDRELQQKGRKILLLQDNFSGHIVLDNLQNIQVENFEPNLTMHVQPKDQGIIHCFKAHYWARFIQWAINNYDQGITPAEIYHINQLQAMRLADLAWCEVNTTTIQNCWRKAGILPDICNASTPVQPAVPISSLLNNPLLASEPDPITNVEKQVEHVLDALTEKGALQKSNQMDIESLLNPAGEFHILSETSHCEIYQAIMDAAKAHENSEINGSDNIDGDVAIRPRPTRWEVLQAMSTIGSYIEDLNDPIACKIKAIVGSFNMQVHLDEVNTMKPTFMTDYYKRV